MYPNQTLCDSWVLFIPNYSFPWTRCLMFGNEKICGTQACICQTKDLRILDMSETNKIIFEIPPTINLCLLEPFPSQPNLFKDDQEGVPDINLCRHWAFSIYPIAITTQHPKTNHAWNGNKYSKPKAKQWFNRLIKLTIQKSPESGLRPTTQEFGESRRTGNSFSWPTVNVFRTSAYMCMLT